MRILSALLLCGLVAASAANGQQGAQPLERISVAGENASLEWFFLLTDTAANQGIWTKHGLQAELLPAPLNSAQLKERLDSGAEVGFVNAAEVPLARLNGVPVKTVAGYLGPTVAKIFVSSEGAIKTPKELDGKKWAF
jgi:hypothetical protein